MNRLIMVWAVASMLIVVTAVTGKTAEVTSLTTQAATDRYNPTCETCGRTDALADEVSESVLWSFGATSDDAEQPFAPLLADKKGNLYGTTAFGGTNYSGGTVFELSPPSGQQTQWTESVLWSFGPIGDGFWPFGGVIADKDGNLYGTTEFGGANNSGTVFELSPPNGKHPQWTERLLWSFGGPTSDEDGALPFAGLIADQRGNLYGTTEEGGASVTSGGGTVFELSPPSGKQTQWSESVLWSFGVTGDDGYSPEASLIADTRGNLYGTTWAGGTNFAGTVFELSPPTSKQTQWSESVLWSFGVTSDDGVAPQAALIVDNQGNLYGTTVFGGETSGANCLPYGCGTVFKLGPPTGKQTQWTESLLWTFGGATSGDGSQPYGGLLADKRGNLYGTTDVGGGSANCYSYGCGTVFELSQPSDKHTPWEERLLWSFGGATSDDGQYPYAGLIAERGNLYGTTAVGGGSNACYGSSCGTVFELTLP